MIPVHIPQLSTPYIEMLLRPTMTSTVPFYRSTTTVEIYPDLPKFTQQGEGTVILQVYHYH